MTEKKAPGEHANRADEAQPILSQGRNTYSCWYVSSNSLKIMLNTRKNEFMIFHEHIVMLLEHIRDGMLSM